MTNANEAYWAVIRYLSGDHGKIWDAPFASYEAAKAMAAWRMADTPAAGVSFYAALIPVAERCPEETS